MLKAGDPSFASAFRAETASVDQFSKALGLVTLRRKAERMPTYPRPTDVLRLAIIGAASLRPLSDLIVHFIEVLCERKVELWLGDFDNYHSEILDSDSELYAFAPEVVYFLPSESRCRYPGKMVDPREVQRQHIDDAATEILNLCDHIRQHSGAEVILANFRLPSGFDTGPMRTAGWQSDYAFRRAVNTELGLRAAAYIHICDVEFLANRIGTMRSSDPRTWFESKQPYASELTLLVAREVSEIVARLRRGTKKVIVLDLDNTLWGGVIGDDGLEGIEVGTTSPRGEAFRDFQAYVKSLAERGVVLAVASKNDHERAIEPFLSHPEMVLRLSDIASFKANWEPKSDNIQEMAMELNLGLDSFVFVDDNPAEIEIVRQFLPEVTAIWIGDDPSAFRTILQDSRLFETRTVTGEDAARSEAYQREGQRQALKSQATDMDSYLSSLEMVAQIAEFSLVDAPRVAQLINRSNQFNLTTRRRSEAEVLAVMQDPSKAHFTVRLSDRFGDHGLIAIVIGQIEDDALRIDTWLMSCRVLKRQVEELTLNRIFEIAQTRGCGRVIGEYFPTAKNAMVSDLYARLGFPRIQELDSVTQFERETSTFSPNSTHIKVQEVVYG